MEKDKKVILCLIGAPGSGKTTLAHTLEKEYRFGKILSGELGRQIAKTDTELGRQALSFMSRREPFSAQVLRDILTKPLNTLLTKVPHVVLDGVPRRWEQVRVLESMITTHRIIFVHLRLDEKACEERILNSLQERGGRHDDANESVRKTGFEIYKNEIVPLTQKIAAEYPNDYIEIESTEAPNMLAQEIVSLIS